MTHTGGSRPAAPSRKRAGSSFFPKLPPVHFRGHPCAKVAGARVGQRTSFGLAWRRKTRRKRPRFLAVPIDLRSAPFPFLCAGCPERDGKREKGIEKALEAGERGSPTGGSLLRYSKKKMLYQCYNTCISQQRKLRKDLRDTNIFYIFVMKYY